MSERSDLAIRVAGLSKEFKLYSRPSDMFFEMLSGTPRYKSFWALRDVTFDVNRGQAVGVLGRNGAGKSTLLKIITGTLDKTSGTVETRGRTSSILELGTGFSGEYTGRENIYLGGLMVGMTREEIKAKEDWIIEFSELRNFIDQPFKTYSTGMQARLTFSTAVCIDPDILIIDEALSVGDARFARKSFAKMEEFRKEGRTILLVSHDTNQVATFCDHAIIMENGQVFDQGSPARLRGVYYDLLFGKGDEHIASGQTIEPTEASIEQKAVQLLDDDELDEEAEQQETAFRLDTNAVTNESGWCWQAEIAEIKVEGDSTESPSNSPLLLCENGRALGSGHASHDSIRRVGCGLYSHWGRKLYFATSDNSDPRTNGREYSLVHADAREFFENTTELPERRAIRRAALARLGLRSAFVDTATTAQTRYGSGKAEFLDYGILDTHGERVKQLVSGERYTLFSRAVLYENVATVSTGFSIFNVYGAILYGVNCIGQEKLLHNVPKGRLIETKADVTMCLTNGVYFLSVAIADADAEKNVQLDQRLDALQFEVEFRKGIHSTSIVDLDGKFSVNWS